MNRRTITWIFATWLLGAAALAQNAQQNGTQQNGTQQNGTKTSSARGVGEEKPGPAITIYNADFAVVRQPLELNLGPGINRITFADATAHIEPDSVVLRDPSNQRTLQILEQNYRNDPVSQAMMLSLYEGKAIDFEVQRYRDNDDKVHVDRVQGKIIRSGYANGVVTEPVIEVNGELIFHLPGQPIFPALADGTVLNPTLDWLLQTNEPGPVNAELSYVTGGLSWHADYNLVAPTSGDTIDLVGWITINNHSGKEFANSRIKLMAGDVNKIQTVSGGLAMAMKEAVRAQNEPSSAVVTEKAFDEYHLYTLEHATTLRDNETKQVEFIAATHIKSERLYVYDGAAMPGYYYSPEQVRDDPNYGTQSNTKIWVMQEFRNSKANNLGIPLPKGRLRFYRRDDDGALQFTGENMIDHTPADELVRVYTGNSFDLVGERRRTYYRVDSSHHWMDESFEIKVRNHKKEAMDVRVVEHLYRWTNWQITDESTKHVKTDAQTAEFRVHVPANGEQVVTYTVHYSW